MPCKNFCASIEAFLVFLISRTHWRWQVFGYIGWRETLCSWCTVSELKDVDYAYSWWEWIQLILEDACSSASKVKRASIMVESQSKWRENNQLLKRHWSIVLRPMIPGSRSLCMMKQYEYLIRACSRVSGWMDKPSRRNQQIIKFMRRSHNGIILVIFTVIKPAASWAVDSEFKSLVNFYDRAFVLYLWLLTGSQIRLFLSQCFDKSAHNSWEFSLIFVVALSCGFVE